MFKFLMNHMQKINNNQYIVKEWEDFLRWEWAWTV